MKAVVFHGVGDITLDDVPEPKIQWNRCGNYLTFMHQRQTILQ